MDMTGERHIPAPRQRVWEALNDPAILRQSIPGCRSLESTGENAFRAVAAVKIGPIATNFTGDVTLLDLAPPASYRIEGSGQGGPAGFARGGAKVSLAEADGGTLLSYVVNAEVGGKLAQLGARLIDASAKQMSDQFFDNFTRQVTVTPKDAAPAADPAMRAEVAALEDGSENPTPAAQAGPVSAGFTLPPPAKISVLSMIPAEINGFPLVAWIGGAAFLFILFKLFSVYL